MVAPTPAPLIRHARFALFAVFGLNGMLSAVWIVHIPAVTLRTGVTATTLGMLILFMSGWAIAGMQTAGPLADRFGSRTLTATAATILSVALLGPAFATGPLTLAIALAAWGFGNGALDVSMNAQAVQVERRYGRPIMSAFHAFFSCGGLLGSLAGAAAQHAHWNIHATFLLFCAAGLAIVATATPRLLPHTGPGAMIGDEHPAPANTAAEAAGHANRAGGEADPQVPPRRAAGTPADGPARQAADPDPPIRHIPAGASRASTTRKVLALGGIAFAMLMAEGVAADWSALQVRDRLEASAGTAGLAFAAFSLTMTLGRFGADRVSGRFGRVALVRWGSGLAGVGFVLVVVSGWIPLTLAGWALCGLGLSGGIPQVFTAAGNLAVRDSLAAVGDSPADTGDPDTVAGTAPGERPSHRAATDMSRVFGLGYLGLLAGPAIIGWLTELVSLTTAMAVPLVAMLLCAGAASTVAPARTTR